MQRAKKNRKNHRRPANSTLVATADHTGKQPQQGLPNHFNELMESPCTNHAYLVKHLYKDYELLKRLLRQAGGQGSGRLKVEVIRPDAYRLKEDSGDILTNAWNSYVVFLP